MVVIFSREQIKEVLLKDQPERSDIIKKFSSLPKTRYDSVKLWTAIKHFAKLKFDVDLKETLRTGRTSILQVEKLERFLSNLNKSEISFDSNIEPVCKKRKASLNSSFLESFEDLDAQSIEEKYERLQKDFEMLKKDHDRIKTQNLDLIKKNEALEKSLAFEQAKNKEITDFVSRKSHTGGFGQPSEKMQQFLMKAVLNAESSTSISNSLLYLKESLSETFATCEPFSQASIVRLRSLIPEVQKAFLCNFLDESECLVLSHDTSPTGDRVDLLAITCKNQNNQSVLISMFPVADKSAQNMANEVIKNLQSAFEDRFLEVVQKIDGVISDRAAAALKCSKLICEKLNELYKKPRLFSSCYMHLLMHLEAISVKASAVGNSNEFSDLLTNISIVYGRRLKAGYSNESLAQDLSFSSTAKIQSSAGSRFHQHVSNSREIVRCHSEILAKSRANEETNKRCKNIVQTLQNNLQQTLMSAALVSLAWSCICAPLSRQISKLVSISKARQIFQDIFLIVELFKNGEIQSILNKTEESETNVNALKISKFVKENFDSLPDQIKTRTLEITRKIGNLMYLKIKKDTTEIFSDQFQLPASSLISLSNQDNERVFGHLKTIDSKYIHGSILTEILLSASKFNKLSTFCNKISVSSFMPSNLKEHYLKYLKTAEKIDKIYKAERTKVRGGIYLRQSAKDKLFEILMAEVGLGDSKLVQVPKIMDNILQKLPAEIRVHAKRLFKQMFVYVLTGEFHKTAAQASEHLENLLE